MAVLFDKATFEKLQSEVPKYKMITPSILVDRLRVRPPGPRRVRRPRAATRGTCGVPGARAIQAALTASPPPVEIAAAQISGSLARLAMKMLEEDGKIKAITKHSKQWLYTRATNQV